MSKKPEQNGTYQLITSPNALKARIGIGLGIDTVLAEKANDAAQDLRGDFRPSVASAIVQIAAQISLLENTEDETAEFATEILRISCDLHQQSVAFGNPLVADVCTSLYGYLENSGPHNAPPSQIVNAHIDVLRSIIGNTVDVEGGDSGNMLLERLNLPDANSRR